MEDPAVADHVEDVLGHDGSLTNHPNHLRPRGQDEASNTVVLLDDTAVRRARDRTHFNGSVHAAYRARLIVIRRDQLLLRRGLRRA